MVATTKDKLHNLKSITLVVLSALLYAGALRFFVDTANLMPAGLIGLARIIIYMLDLYLNISLPYMLLYFIFQVILTTLVFKVIGRRFALLSILHFTLTTAFSTIIPTMTVSDDIILVAIFGGVITGTSVLLALLGEASTGGTDFVAVYFQNISNIPIWDYVMYFNWAILVVAGFYFGIEAALYSMVYQYVSTTLLNTFNSRNRLITLTIITTHGAEISQLLLDHVNHGVTVTPGHGAYSKQPKEILYTVVNQFEVNMVVEQVSQVDPKAFIYMSKTEKVFGNFKKRKIT